MRMFSKASVAVRVGKDENALTSVSRVAGQMRVYSVKKMWQGSWEGENVLNEHV